MSVGSVRSNVTSTCVKEDICHAYLDVAMDMISKVKGNIPTSKFNASHKFLNYLRFFLRYMFKGQPNTSKTFKFFFLFLVTQTLV